MHSTTSLNLPGASRKTHSSPAQRLLDLLIALPATIILLPVFALLAVWIKRDSHGPVFFLQERVGRSGQLFRIWKFRTMITDAEQRGAPLTVGRDPRITRSGHFLRHYRIDELPQLFNVLKGEMSIVGPRPEMPRYVALYTTEQKRILNFRPGITSPASIAFINESALLAAQSYPEAFYCAELLPAKIEQDLRYAQQATVWSDCVIIAKTARRLMGNG